MVELVLDHDRPVLCRFTDGTQREVSGSPDLVEAVDLLRDGAHLPMNQQIGYFRFRVCGLHLRGALKRQKRLR